MVTPWRRIYTVLGLQKQTRDSPSATSKLELKTMAPALVAALFVAVSSLAGEASAQATPDKPAPQQKPAAPVPAPTLAPAFLSPYDRDTLTPEYRIAPGDALHVFVWKEPDLSREVRVRPDGFVTFPLLGDVFAVAKTPKGLAAELAQQLAQFVNSPLVTVTLGDSSTLRFYVVGEVQKPGEFPLVGRTTVMQALALAGGFREYAKTDEVKIIRQELSVTGGRTQTREIVLPINYKAIAQGQNLHQNFALKPGDVIVVP
jgi:polysaccharide export outer membrane protein